MRICAREGCSKPLPEGSARQRKFCTKRCQVAEWRRRNDENSSPAEEACQPPDL